jgi:hypothetical protein
VVENPRVVGAEEALDLLPELLRPLLRFVSLPGFLLLDRTERPAICSRRSRRRRASREIGG